MAKIFVCARTYSHSHLHTTRPPVLPLQVYVIPLANDTYYGCACIRMRAPFTSLGTGMRHRGRRPESRCHRVNYCGGRRVPDNPGASAGAVGGEDYHGAPICLRNEGGASAETPTPVFRQSRASCLLALPNSIGKCLVISCCLLFAQYAGYWNFHIGVAATCGSSGALMVRGRFERCTPATAFPGSWRCPRWVTPPARTVPPPC